VGLSVGFEGSRTSTDSEMLSKAQQFSEKNGMAELLQHSIRDSKEGRFNFMDTEGHSYGQSIATNLNNANSQVDSAQAHFSKADVYQEQASYFKQNAVNIDQDLSKQYWDSLVKELGVEKAQHIVSNPELNYQQMQQFTDSKREAIRNQFDKEAKTNPALVQEKYRQDKENIKQYNDPQTSFTVGKSMIYDRAEKKGLTTPIRSDIKNNVETNLEKTKNELNDRNLKLEDKEKKLSNHIKEELGDQE
jgi:hypothetical protein